MTPRVEIDVLEGDTWEFVIELRDAAGEPFDFSGLTGYLQVRLEPSASPLASLTSAPGEGLQLDVPTAGDITVTVPSTATSNLCRRGQPIHIPSELEFRDGGSPARVKSYAALVFVVEPERTKQ